MVVAKARSGGVLSSPQAKTGLAALGVTLMLIYVGSAGLLHFDRALMGYALATVIAITATAVRLGAYVGRAATRRLVRRGLTYLARGPKAHHNVTHFFRQFVVDFVAQRFIYHRSLWRWVQHLLIAWGVIGSFAFTIPLTFGWFHFKVLAANTYTMYAGTIPVLRFPLGSLVGTLIFNGLNLSALALLLGLTMAIVRRLFFRDVKVDQRLEYDLFPLYLLLTVTLTGLALTVSYRFFRGQLHPEIRLVHQAAVVIMLLYFPFSKLFHLFVRPLAQLVDVYHKANDSAGLQRCARCDRVYASQRQIEDVKDVLAAQGWVFPVSQEAGAGSIHVAELCYDCKRIHHGLVWSGRGLDYGPQTQAQK